MRRIWILLLLSLITISCGQSSGTVRLVPQRYKATKSDDKIIYLKSSDNSEIILFNPDKEKVIAKYNFKNRNLYRILEEPSNNGVYASVYTEEKKIIPIYIEKATGNVYIIDYFDQYSGWFGIDISSNKIYVAGINNNSTQLYAAGLSMPNNKITEITPIPAIWNSKYRMIRYDNKLVMSLVYNDTGSQLYFPEHKISIDIVKDYFGSNDNSSLYFLGEDLLNANFLYNDEKDERNLYKLYKIEKLGPELKDIKLKLIYSMEDPFNYLFKIDNSYIVFSNGLNGEKIVRKLKIQKNKNLIMIKSPLILKEYNLKNVGSYDNFYYLLSKDSKKIAKIDKDLNLTEINIE
ncbi:MAG: hypothetical protein PQJ46_08035 [Spirochaetales bacterium]|nr:hypothetical protein [Spirochaetales bacterium]